MIIIVEGLDKVGKSTLIKDIRTVRWNSIIFKLSPYYKPTDADPTSLHDLEVAYDEMFNQARQISHDQFRDVIFDRAYPSELVYSIKRGYDAMDNKFWWDLDLGLKGFGPVVLIYCEVDKETGLKRLESEGEDYLKAQEYEQLRARYELVINKSALKVIRVDTTKDRAKNLIDVLTELKHHEYRRYEN